jgi:peptide/nickel transport system ATP-binding protein
MTVGEAIADVFRTHGIIDERGKRIAATSEGVVREAALRALADVGLRPAEFFYAKYPDELSGGQKQRVVAARVLALRPRIIIADEPVAMLDMSVRARMLEFLLELKDRYHLTYIFITHDLATAKFMCDRIAIMYLGRIVEAGPAKTIYADPKHPYTRALLQAIPIPDPERRTEKVLPRGEVPNAVWPPAGCRFHPRCPAALAICGWEGRDFVSFLEERWLPSNMEPEESTLGPVEAWEPSGFEARRESSSDDNPARIAERIRQILSEAGGPMGQAVTAVAVEADEVVVRFRPPDLLAPKEVDGRIVECLLY